MKYRRILLKLSGEALMGEQNYGIDPQRLAQYAQDIQSVAREGVEIGLVIGGGNIFRGMQGAAQGMDRVQGDYMGMLATVINGLALQGALEEKGLKTRLQTAIEMERIAEPFIKRKAVRHLEKKCVVIFSAGTGNPFFSTDTAAALRAVEIGADAILLAKNVDGVYDSDPRVNPEAKLLRDITYQEVQERDLKVMDASAITICRENKVPCIRVFGLDDPQNILRVIEGDMMGTVVHP